MARWLGAEAEILGSRREEIRQEFQRKFPAYENPAIPMLNLLVLRKATTAEVRPCKWRKLERVSKERSQTPPRFPYVQAILRRSKSLNIAQRKTAMDDSVFRRLALTAYEAATDATRWHVLLEDLRATFEATTVSIFTPVVGANQRLLAAASGMDPGAQALIANWVPHDPWLKTRLDQGLPMNTGLTVIGSEYLPWSQLERTDFFQECGRRVGVKGLISLVIEGDQGRYGVPRTHLALSREPSLPEFGDHHAKFLRALGKPLRAALQSYFALEQLQAISTTLEDCFEAVPQPLFVLGADREILYANRAGTALLRQGVVANAVNGYVSNVGNLSGSGLEHVTTAAATGVGRAVPFWWIADDDVHTGVAHIGGFSPLSALRDRWSVARVVLLLEIDQAPRRKAARLTALARLHQLTPAEVRVLVRLSEGMRPDAVAAAETLSVATVRTHITHLLQKTGAIGTFDLIRLLVG